MPSKKQPSTSKSPRRIHNKSVAGVNRPPQAARPTTKKQQLIELLSGTIPAAAETISKRLGWKPHTVRAAITGLRKTGFVVENSKGLDGEGTCYRIVGKHRPSSEAA
jgi:predicted ArsR family transcriptional regulator